MEINLFSTKRNSYIANENTFLEFLHGGYESGYQYSSINPLSSVITVRGCNKLSRHSLISRYVKDILNRNPSLPKYTDIWEIKKNLAYYESLFTNTELTFTFLWKKLIALSSALKGRILF